MFAIQYHEHLGVLIVPYLVQESQCGQFMHGCQRLYGQTVHDYFDTLSDLEEQLIKLTDECSDPHLCRKFSKCARNAEALYTELSESKLKALVIPYTQSRISKCLQLMQEAEMPLYFKGEKDKPVDNEEIPVAKETAHAVFHFIKDKQGLRYKLDLKQQGVDIPLLGAGSLVLVDDPGWVLVNRMVCRLEDGVDSNKVQPFFDKEFVTIPGSFEEKYFKSFMLNTIKNYKVLLEGIRLDAESPPCLPVLKLEVDMENHPILMLYFHYNQRRCQATDSNTFWVELLMKDGQYGFRKTHRDLASEKGYMQSLRRMGLVNRGKNSFFVLDKADSLPAQEASLSSVVAVVDKQSAEKQSSPFQLNEWIGTYSEDLQAHGFSIEQDS